MKIGFDFDKVIVDYPPIVPASFINFCYRYGVVPLGRNSTGFSYRIPGALEQKLRLLTHFQLLRPPIKKNIDVIKKINDSSNHKLYLVSGRFSFLRKRTDLLLESYKLKGYFEKIYFNFDDEQPHKFKERTIRSEKIKIFVDDDIDLIEYLAKKLPHVSFFWVTTSGKSETRNITPVANLSIFYNKYLKNYGK